MKGELRDRDLVDVLATLVLAALVLGGWWTTYAGSAWWIAALVTGLLAASVVVVARDVGSNVLVVLSVLLVALAVAAGPLAADTLAITGGDIFGRGLAALGEAWPELLGTHPRVDAAGPLLLPPVVVALVVVGLGSAVALWTTRPAAPLVPVAVGQAAVLLLGRHETGHAVLLGAGTAVVALLWVRLRAGRRDEGRFGVDPVRARGLVLSLLLLAVAAATAAVVVGEDDADRFVLRDRVEGYDVTALRTPLDQFRDFTPQPGDDADNVAGQRLFLTEGLAPGTRLRFVALDDYDGTRWRAANDTDPVRRDDKFLHVGTTIEDPAPGQTATAEITATRHWDRPWVPVVGAVQSFVSMGDDLRPQLRYNPATQTALLPDGLGADVSYTFRTRLTDRRAEPTQETTDVHLDRELQFRTGVLDPVVFGWDVGSPTSMSRLFDLLRRLREVGRFSHGAQPWERGYRAGHGLRRLAGDFLLAEPTVGDQEQYAAAAALLATRLGIPARVVVGAVVPRNGVIRGEDVTAWIEVRLADDSWRTIPTEVFMSRKPPDRRGPPPAARSFPPLPPGEPPPSDPTGGADEPRDRAEDADTDGSDGSDGGGGPLRVVLLGLLVLLVVPLVPWALKWLRRRRRRRAATVSARYAGAWDELVDGARDLGVPVTGRATRPVQAATMGRAEGLARVADSRIFSADDLDAGEAAEFWRLVRDELDGLGAERPRWRRWWAALNPRSLVGR